MKQGLQLLALAFLAAVFTALSGRWAHHIEIVGAGATFPAPIYARWIALYNRDHNQVKFYYHPVGSGGGIRAIMAREVDFGASDVLLDPGEEQTLQAPLLPIPTVLGPVVIAYYWPGVDDEIMLSGDVIADIYLGKITHWQDARIAAINPEVDLPDLPIHAAHRSDSSGTTHIFTDYLAAVSAEWAEKVGRGKTVRWPADPHWSGEGNDGVAHRILLRPGGIGYLELKYAQNAGLRYATLINSQGNAVRPTVDSVQRAEESTPALPRQQLKPSIVNAPGANAYPIAGFSYLLVYRDLTYLSDAARERALVAFLRWCLTEGQTSATELQFTPLPDSLRQWAIRQIETIKTSESTADPPLK